MWTGWIIAADPGVHTGLVFLDPNGDVDESTTALSEEEIGSFLDDKGAPSATLVVIESFAGAGNLRRETITTLTRLGFIHGYVHRKGLTVHFQPPQARLAYEENAKLVFPRHDDRHMRSALAHALRARDSYRQ